MIFSILRKLYNENSKTTSLCLSALLVMRLIIDQVFSSTGTQWLPPGTEMQAWLQPTDCSSSQHNTACSPVPRTCFCNHCVVILIQHLSFELCKGSLIFLSILCLTKSWGNRRGGKQRATTNPKATSPIKFHFFGEKPKPFIILKGNGCNEELLTQA